MDLLTKAKNKTQKECWPLIFITDQVWPFGLFVHFSNVGRPLLYKQADTGLICFIQTPFKANVFSSVTF